MSRYYLITVWGFELKPTLAEGVRYVAWQHEKGPSSGKDHQHWYVELSRPQRYSFIQKWVGSKEIKILKPVDRKKAREYCMVSHYNKKDKGRVAGPWELGTQGRQGQRSDLEEVAKLLKKDGMLEVAKTMPEMIIKYSNGLSKLESLYMEAKAKEQGFVKLHVEFHHGPAGTGKTRYAWEKEKGDLHVPIITEGGKIWWQGYRGQEAILLDDLSPTSLPLEYLLRILSGYPVSIENKGGHSYALYKRVYITSNWAPETFWGWPESLARRCNVVTKWPR